MKNKNFFFDSRDVLMLPRNMRDEFFGRDTKNFNFAEEGLNQNERAALDPILRKFEFKSVYRVPRVNAPEGIHTPDLLINGVKVEIKSPKSARRIQNNILEAYSQSDNGIVLLDTSRIQGNIKEVQAEIEKTMRMHAVKGYAMSNNKLLFGFESKRKNPATAGDTTHDSGSFQARIIAHDSKKINQIFGADVRTFKPRQRTKSYWARRSEQRMNEALKILTSQQKLITRAYTDAQRNLTREVKSLYKNAYKNDQTFDQTKLREIVPNGEISRFKTEMKKAGLKTNLPENYRARANRLEFLQAQIRGELQKVAQKENQISAKIHSETLQNSYYKTIFHTAQGFGAMPIGNSRNFAEIPELPRKLYKKVYGANYDPRTWKLRESSGLSSEEKAALQPLIQSEKVKKFIACVRLISRRKFAPQIYLLTIKWRKSNQFLAKDQ